MPSRVGPLHWCMTGLVFLNLVFVTLTEAAEPMWLAPLAVLTLASPWLARFRESRLYRAAWNLVVVAFLGLLVHHAMSAQLAYVLQDGLVLAVLCQVHLLNNLHEEQRPDLLFLNSFLIAIITGYITVDLGFSVAFLAYVPFWVIGLAYLAVSRDRGRVGDARVVAYDALRRGGVLMGLTLLVFLFWPRDFQRQALLAKYFEFDTSTSNYDVDFSRTLDLERRGKAKAVAKPVLTATLVQGSRKDVDELWRGAVLDDVDRSGGWSPGAYRRDPWATAPETEWRYGMGGLTASREATDVTAALDVVRVGGRTQNVFLPRGAAEIDLAPIHTAGKLRMRMDGGMEYSNPGELRYRVSIGAPSSTAPFDMDVMTDLPRSPHVRTAADLAARLSRRVASDAPAAKVAREFSSYLAGRYAYVAPFQDGGAETLHAFLTTDAGGHCEYFASTLAIMLRSLDIPARVVTGFRAHNWAPDGRTIEVTSLDAHAWVEAFDEDEGWIELDPTPAAESIESGQSLFDRASAAVTALWTRVTSFDAEARAAVMAWVAALPKRIVSSFTSRPLDGVAMIVVVLALVVCVRDRRLGRTPPEVRALRDAAKHAGLTLLPAETPRELLERARVTDVPNEARAALEGAVAAHERARYGRGERAA